jgi:hypothetical protein
VFPYTHPFGVAGDLVQRTVDSDELAVWRWIPGWIIYMCVVVVILLYATDASCLLMLSVSGASGFSWFSAVCGRCSFVARARSRS